MVAKKSETEQNVELMQFPNPELWAVLAKAAIESRGFGEFASGAVAGALSKTVVAPLETVRTRLIVGVGPRSINGSVKRILQEQGWRGLFAGNAINAIRCAPCQAVELSTFEAVKRMLFSMQHQWEQDGPPQIELLGQCFNVPVSMISTPAVAGAVAGVVSTLLTYPLEVLKDRFTVHTGAYDSILHGYRKILREEGGRALYRGLSPTMIGLVPYCASYYALYDSMTVVYRRSADKTHLAPLETLVIGSMAGLGSSVGTFPLEVARKRLMVGRFPAGSTPSMFKLLREVLREEGLKGWYRGVGASCLKVMPSSGLSWMFYEACKDAFHVSRQI